MHARRQGWIAQQVPIYLEYPRLNCTMWVHVAWEAFVARHVGLCAAVGHAVRHPAPQPLCTEPPATHEPRALQLVPSRHMGVFPG